MRESQHQPMQMTITIRECSHAGHRPPLFLGVTCIRVLNLNINLSFITVWCEKKPCHCRFYNFTCFGLLLKPSHITVLLQKIKMRIILQRQPEFFRNMNWSKYSNKLTPFCPTSKPVFIFLCTFLMHFIHLRIGRRQTHACMGTSILTTELQIACASPSSYLLLSFYGSSFRRAIHRQ